MNRIRTSSLVIAMISALQGCGGGGSSDPDTMGRSGSGSTVLTINITDAPVDNATQVWIQFAGLSIKPVDGDAIDFPFSSPMNINLLNLYGNRSEALISNEAVPGGEYEWIRLDVNAIYDSVLDSYIVLNDGSEHELDIPSGSNTGLQINNVGLIEPNTKVNLTIDFDLSRSVVVSSGDYHLKPVLRLVDNDEVGTLTGEVDEGLLVVNCSDADPGTGNAIYVFANNITPDDIDGNYPEPVTVAKVEYNSTTGNYEYEVGFLPEGRYTVAFTCQSDLDDPEADDAIVFGDVRNNVNVEAGEEDTNIFR